jgi:CHAT domain
MPPIILITYANDAQAPLRVATEAKAVQRLLEQVPNKAYTIKLLPEVSTADLAEDLMHIEQDLEVLHYCGHANADALAFTDKHAGAAKLAERLRFCKNLQFVFLNGCLTRDQVRFFHEAGVPYILATSAKVNDDEALWFALQVYKYLSLGNEVMDAFERAKADAALENRDMVLVLSRGAMLVSRLDLDEKDEQHFDWGLYAQEGSKGYQLALKKQEASAPEPGLSDAKNVVADSSITAGGDVHIGDKQVIQNAEKIYNIDKIDNANFD